MKQLKRFATVLACFYFSVFFQMCGYCKAQISLGLMQHDTTCPVVLRLDVMCWACSIIADKELMVIAYATRCCALGVHARDIKSKKTRSVGTSLCDKDSLYVRFVCLHVRHNKIYCRTNLPGPKCISYIACRVMSSHVEFGLWFNVKMHVENCHKICVHIFVYAITSSCVYFPWFLPEVGAI